MNDTIDSLSAQLSEAVEKAGEALQLLALAISILFVHVFTIISHALRLAATIARPLALLACAALAVYGSAHLWLSLSETYGDDLPAAIFALAMTAIIPTALFVTAKQPEIFPILLASGAISLASAYLLRAAPQPVTGLLPGVALSGCILYLTFGTPPTPEIGDLT